MDGVLQFEYIGICCCSSSLAFVFNYWYLAVGVIIRFVEMVRFVFDFLDQKFRICEEV